jgi:dihydrofolate synthase/folylpolyglutamate synthase
MNFDEALGYMQGRLRLGVKLGNERFQALLTRLGNPQNQLRVVHIAGTKGKGSTTAMAASILQTAGAKVGMYLSPYVYDVRERIQINGEMISCEDFARWVTAIQPHIEALEATEFGPTTEFELKTAVGLCYFAEQAVEYAVLEVGLGGRLDATNVISRPLVTVITNIGLDHMELLGETLGEIAGEKAGIVKSGIPCVTGVPVGGEAWGVISKICAERGAPLLAVTPPQTGTQGMVLTTPRRQVTVGALRLRGAYQAQNAATALAALDAVAEEALPTLTDDVVRRGLESAWVPGRLEQVREHPTVVLDVAHNEMSAQVLADALRDQYGADKRRLFLVVGLSRHHDPDPFLAPLAALHPWALIAAQPGFRPRPALDVAAAARRHDFPNVQIVESGVTDAVRSALSQAGPDDLICITGSFYTVGDVPPAFWSSLS